jgi:hypothetical protein
MNHAVKAFLILLLMIALVVAAVIGGLLLIGHAVEPYTDPNALSAALGSRAGG